MKPTIGRIVHYNFSEEEKQELRNVGGNNINDRAPAIVVAVWGYECVNLKVMVDGNSPDLWKTSVPMLREGEEPRGYTWTWPVKD